MRLLFVATLCFVVGAVGAVGCGGKATSGGESKKTSTAPDGKTITVDKHFTMAASTDKTQELEQGKKYEATFNFTYGKEFEGKLKIEVKPGKGLTADPKTKELTNADKTFTVTVTADKTAAVGDTDLTVTATPPEPGTMAEKKINFKIKEAK